MKRPVELQEPYRIIPERRADNCSLQFDKYGHSETPLESVAFRSEKQCNFAFPAYRGKHVKIYANCWSISNNLEDR